MEGTMKLYSYSSELLTCTEAKWAKAKFFTYGMLIAIIIFFGFMKPNQSIGNAFGSRPANTLATENNFLRQQVSMISPRVSKLEMQAKQLNKRADELHLLLGSSEIAGDTVARLVYAANGLKFRPLISAAARFRP
jgi:hypothetical protein